MQTYLCAKASGDMTYLQWLRDRLIYVYREDRNVDFVLTIDNFVTYFHKRAIVPGWLDWIMRRYGV